MALIFVPTKADPSKADIIMAMISAIAGRLVVQRSRLSVQRSLPYGSGKPKFLSSEFESDRQTYKPQFQRNPLFMVFKDLIVPNNEHTSLLDYLECRIANHTIDAVNVKFGGFVSSMSQPLKLSL